MPSAHAHLSLLCACVVPSFTRILSALSLLICTQTRQTLRGANRCVLADRPAYRTHLRYCMFDSDRKLWGFRLCNVLSFFFGRRIESFELPPDQIVRCCLLYMHSVQELGRHLRHLRSSEQQPFDVNKLPKYIDGKRYPQARVTISLTLRPRST